MLTWTTQLLVATIFILVIDLWYFPCHRIMEAALDNLEFGDKNSTLIFSVQYLHSQSVMEVDLDNLAFSDNNFYYSILYLVFSLS